MFNKREGIGKVVRLKMRHGIRVDRELEYRKRGNDRIFENPKFIAINSKGELCVSDDFQNCIIVISNVGALRFQYDGRYSGKTTPFEPQGLVSDDVDNIYVADRANDCIDVVNPNGNFLQSIMRVDAPIVVAFRDNKLFIVEHEKTSVRVYTT
jgi:DNA-binding beta-propeller fold protein YncE